jgi:hypothetical protein
MAAIVSASVYALAGTGIAASSHQLPRPGVIKTVRVEAGIVNRKTHKTIRRETLVAKIVRLGSAAAKQAGAAPPASGSGPSSVCMEYTYLSGTTPSGSYDYVEFVFGSSPFIVGSMFNQSNALYVYAEQTEAQFGDDVYVAVFNNSPGTETLAGYYGVDYFC